MSFELDRRLFEDLKVMDAGEVCRRALCWRDPSRATFDLELWGHLYGTCPERCEILPLGPCSPPVNTAISLAIIYYLLRARDLPLKGEWVSEKDLPGGEQFFRGPHEIPAGRIAEAYGDDLAGFRARCEQLEGKPLAMGDGAYAFRFLPRVPVAVVLWRRDEEFKARSRLLFDRTISEHLPLDVIFSLSWEICGRLTDQRLITVEK